jgi:hypothetical protein
VHDKINICKSNRKKTKDRGFASQPVQPVQKEQLPDGENSNNPDTLFQETNVIVINFKMLSPKNGQKWHFTQNTDILCI